MSVLSFPRIYFQGFMSWDPPTGNNNDQFPTYAYDKAALNWDYLKQFGIDQTNFTTTFRDWMTTTRAWGKDKKGNTLYSPPAEWNYFGTNACYFVQFSDPGQGIDRKSRITGGASGFNSPVTQDPLIGKPIALIGDLFGSADAARPGRLVDNNPASSYSSQIYFNSLQFGDEATGIAGRCYRRMHQHFIGGLRNPNLPSAGHTSVTWQTCFPAGEGLVIRNSANSSLLKALQNMIDSGQARGVMVRFNTYLNLYYQNGYFNGSPKAPEVLADAPAMYKQALQTENQFVNPCFSRVLGVIGPWFNDELSSGPGGRFLATGGPPIQIDNPEGSATAKLTSQTIHGGPQGGPGPRPEASLPNINVPTADPKGVVTLGVALVEVNRENKNDSDNYILSIDALNTFPEWFWPGNKIDLGEVSLWLKEDSGAPIATFAPKDYDQSSYEANGGIIDIKLDANLKDKIEKGTLILRAPAIAPTPTSPASKNTVDALVEQPWVAQTDDRGIYLNAGETKTFEVAVSYKGQRAQNAKLLVAKYAPYLLSADPTRYLGAAVLAIADKNPQIVNVTSGQSSVVTVTDPSGKGTPIQTLVTVVEVVNGSAKVTISAASAGLPVLVFYPFETGSQRPQPTYDFDNTVDSSITYFAAIRVLSFDDNFIDEFVDLWNSPSDPAKAYDPTKAWDFVYSKILYLYDMIYPVMLRFVPLGDRQRVEAAVDQVLALIAPSYFAESTLAMPITRDLSAGKRTVLQMWGSLVKRGYPPQPISRPPRAQA
ncbi:MAG: hypothetical protein QOD94_721 [Alphaproteobacteria bacterium]|jgi:hypothetical protein|nr:hypothetical protein [Alphaproteobacteria bacterium]